MTLRLGDLLVKSGALTPEQRDAVVEYQRASGRPFGAIAEDLFGVCPAVVEDCWAQQYASIAPRIDPRTASVDPASLELVDRRQAWQFRVLPIGPQPGSTLDAELVVCTTQDHLVRALKFTGWKIKQPCYFVLAEPLALGEALMRHYPMPGMTPQSVFDGAWGSFAQRHAG